MAYRDVRFPDCVSQGATGGPVWDTTIVETGSGYTYANQNRTRPLHVYDVSHAVRKEDLFGLVRAFHYIMNGSAHTFPFRDWADYKCPDASGVGIFLVGQMYKRYTAGAFTFDRKITRPVSSTIVAVGGSLGTLDPTTGIVTGGSAPGWAGEFDVPCRFADDAMSEDLIDGPTAKRIVGWSGIKIQEVKE